MKTPDIEPTVIRCYPHDTAGRTGVVTFMIKHRGRWFQIEHHLFPCMPRPNPRRAPGTVRGVGRSRAVPDTQTSLIRSSGIVLRHLNRVGPDGLDPFDRRFVVAPRPPG